ncbi:MAG TPA: hypothetical protein PLV91_02345, partial [Verrucomicrobiota bacterium]|nr:hypothetical protein [Verrucomicrobiota bacterium]
DYTDIDPMTGMPRIGTGMMLGSMSAGGMGGGGGMPGMGGGPSANQFMRMVQDAQNIGEKYNVYLEPGLRNVLLT